MLFLLSFVHLFVFVERRGRMWWSHNHPVPVMMGMRELPHSSVSQICGIKLH